MRRTLFLMTPGSVYGQDSEVWAWDGTSWTRVPVDDAPSLQGDFVLTYDRQKQRAALFGSVAFNETPFARTFELQGRGAPCAGDAEATTGHCVDGVSCETAACAAACESCNVPGSVGRCAPVVSAPDPDTCAGTQTCDRNGVCKAVLGQAAGSASDCASGFLVDGVCCETSECGFCSTCSAAQKEIPDNDGRCGTQRAGLDLHDACTAEPVELCRNAGVCDGRGGCGLYARGTACGVAGTAAICTGAGECVVQTASCDGEGAVRAPSGRVTSCAGFRCVEGACLGRCTTVDDCVTGSVCTGAGQCLPESAGAEGDGGCSCRTAGHGPSGPLGPGLVAMVALAAACRRKRAAKSANWS